MDVKKLVAIFIVSLCIAVMPAIAQVDNTTANGTTLNETNVTATPTATATVTATTEPTTTPTAEPTATGNTTPVPTEAKFRAAPAVTLRPVNDVIDK